MKAQWLNTVTELLPELPDHERKEAEHNIYTTQLYNTDLTAMGQIGIPRFVFNFAHIT